MTEKSPIITAKDLVKHYDGGQVKALRGVDFAAREGEFVSIMGASGSGKSTLLHCLGSLEKPDKGEVLLAGQNLAKLDNVNQFRASTIGFVFQMHFLLPHLSLIENVGVPLEALKGISKNERIERSKLALESVGLGERLDHTPNKVSGGERQRAALARAIVNKPKVIFADEPTGSVDSETEAKILDLLQKLREETGSTLIVVTHDQAVADRADRVVRMHDGQVVDAS